MPAGTADVIGTTFCGYQLCDIVRGRQFELQSANGLPSLRPEHLHGGVAAVDADDAPTGVGTRPTKKDAGHRRSRLESLVPHELRQTLALEDVPAGEPGVALDVGRPHNLGMEYGIGDVAAEPADRFQRDPGHLLAPSVPVALA